MGAVLFYHITRSPVDATARSLLARALAQDWRVVVRGVDTAGLERLDNDLWLGPEDEFLPHGLAGGPHDADQPVLLTLGAALPNGPAALMALDGADVLPDEVQALERVWVLFDGNDPAAVEAARGQWRALTGAGLSAQYWSEEGGRWDKKTETAARA